MRHTKDMETSRNTDETHLTNSIFQRPWWLDAVAPNSWDAIEIKSGEQVVARMPYVSKKAHGLSQIYMPPLTQTLGPWLARSTAKYAKQLAQQKDLMTSLIEQLPPCDYFQQRFHYSITNWLPFYWKGYEQTTRYTYVLDNLNDQDKLWSDLQENIRREIKKAQKQLIVSNDLPIEQLYESCRKTYQRQNLKVPFDLQLIERIHSACISNSAGRTFFALDSQDRVHASIFIIWDQDSAYYLIGGGDPELRSSGAMSLLLWEAIQFANSVTNRFDFEGSMVEPIERYFRAFGARQVPYFEIRRATPRAKLILGAKEVLRKFK